MFSDNQQTGDAVSANTDSSSPPPPPPELPQMTSFTSVNEITLPNGVKLPSGTKQIFVHPYHPSHPLARHYTEDEFNKLTAIPSEDNSPPINLGYNTASNL
jgi:hypothetical protein